MVLPAAFEAKKNRKEHEGGTAFSVESASWDAERGDSVGTTLVCQAHHSVTSAMLSTGVHGEGDLHEGAHVLELMGQVCQVTGHPLGVDIVAPLIEVIERPLQFLLVGRDAPGTPFGVCLLAGGVQDDRRTNPEECIEKSTIMSKPPCTHIGES